MTRADVLSGAHFLARRDLHLGVAAVGVERLQGDDVVALERADSAASPVFSVGFGRSFAGTCSFPSIAHRRTIVCGPSVIGKSTVIVAVAAFGVHDRRRDGGASEIPAGGSTTRACRGRPPSCSRVTPCGRRRSDGEQSLDSAARRRRDDALQLLVGNLLLPLNVTAVSWNCWPGLTWKVVVQTLSCSDSSVSTVAL